MGSSRWAAGYAAPVVALVLAVLLLGWLTRFTGFYADKLLLLLIVVGLTGLLWARTRRTNRMVARFVAALAHRDLTQTFRSRKRGTGFEELGTAFDQAIETLRAERLASAAETRFSAALANEAPTPLLAIDEGGLIHLANQAARRLFLESDGRSAGHYDRYGADFAHMLAAAAPGDRRICRVRWNGLEQRAVVAVAQADRQGRPWRIVSVQIIQRELDVAEMTVQSNLVRVLTHEIMNSLTPVTSLAESASRLLATVDDRGGEALADARLAVDALARRATSIAHFVESYRAFSEAPAVRIARFAAKPWVEELVRSFRATPQSAGVALDVRPGHDGLMIEGDADLLGQVVLNLLKNAGQALAGRDAPEIMLSIRENHAGRIEIGVADNGPGIAPALAEEIFLPFFTTKPDGTGIGLSFAKQIALLHGGAIGLAPNPAGGATFQLSL